MCRVSTPHPDAWQQHVQPIAHQELPVIVSDVFLGADRPERHLLFIKEHQRSVRRLLSARELCPSIGRARYSAFSTPVVADTQSAATQPPAPLCPADVDIWELD